MSRTPDPAIVRAVDRRAFVATAATIGCGAAAFAASASPFIRIAAQDGAPEPVNPELVKEMVGVSHGNIDRMSELLKQDQTLANALIDWGGGDFESALGAAAHTGGRDRAMLLLDTGARLDIFASTMLGWFDVVKPTIDRKPELVNTPGPHGITLWSHARFGGDEAREVFDYLDAIPGIIKDIRMTDEERAARAGTYTVQPGGAATDIAQFEIVDRFRSLYIKAGGNGVVTRMVTTADNTFHTVRRLDQTISFEMQEGEAKAITFTTANGTTRAVR